MDCAKELFMGSEPSSSEKRRLAEQFRSLKDRIFRTCFRSCRSAKRIYTDFKSCMEDEIKDRVDDFKECADDEGYSLDPELEDKLDSYGSDEWEAMKMQMLARMSSAGGLIGNKVKSKKRQMIDKMVRSTCRPRRNRRKTLWQHGNSDGNSQVISNTKRCVERQLNSVRSIGGSFNMLKAISEMTISDSKLSQGDPKTLAITQVKTCSCLVSDSCKSALEEKKEALCDCAAKIFPEEELIDVAKSCARKAKAYGQVEAEKMDILSKMCQYKMTSMSC